MQINQKLSQRSATILRSIWQTLPSIAIPEAGPRITSLALGAFEKAPSLSETFQAPSLRTYSCLRGGTLHSLQGFGTNGHSRCYSQKGKGTFDKDFEEEEEDEAQLDSIPAEMLMEGIPAASTDVKLLNQVTELPESPDEPEGSRRTVNLGPYPRDLSDWLQQFQVKLVDVNRVNKGSPTGRISQFSALTVAGNKNGIIGLGMGKAAGVGDAIKKANRQAIKTLFYVPRYNNATILHPIVSKFGKCIVKMYPKSSGRGCTASPMMKDICKLAGLSDVGIKVYGSRNIRNTIKALIRGLESQIPTEEQKDLPDIKLKQHKRVKGAPSVQTIGLLNI